MDNDPRLNVSLTPQQADALWRLVEAARAVIPREPPRYVSAAAGSALETEAIRRWQATFKLSQDNLDLLGTRLYESLAYGSMDALERKDCQHPIISHLGPRKTCRRCLKELP